MREEHMLSPQSTETACRTLAANTQSTTPQIYRIPGTLSYFYQIKRFITPEETKVYIDICLQLHTSDIYYTVPYAGPVQSGETICCLREVLQEHAARLAAGTQSTSFKSFLGLQKPSYFYHKSDG